MTEWVPIAARYLRARRAGRTDFRTTAGRQGTSAAGRVLLPAEVGAVEFLAHPHNGGVLGVVVDRRAGLYTAVLEDGSRMVTVARWRDGAIAEEYIWI